MIRNKAQMYALLHAGTFGNLPQVWNTPAELETSGYNGLVMLRCLQAGGKMYADIPAAEAKALWTSLYRANERMVDSDIILQGEVCECPTLELFCSEAKIHMREALKRGGMHLSGLAAKQMLRRSLDPPSYDNLAELLDLYPAAVVEFSAYCTKVGRHRRNTVFWEVRNY
jgi:hypothetical protein